MSGRSLTGSESHAGNKWVVLMLWDGRIAATRNVILQTNVFAFNTTLLYELYRLLVTRFDHTLERLGTPDVCQRLKM